MRLTFLFGQRADGGLNVCLSALFTKVKDKKNISFKCLKKIPGIFINTCRFSFQDGWFQVRSKRVSCTDDVDRLKHHII